MKANRYYTDRRNHELMAAYRNAIAYLLEKYGRIDYLLAVDRARYTATSRYFVDEYTAERIISRMEVDAGCTDCMTGTRRSMYNFLYNEYLKLKEKYSNSSKRELVAMACCMKAPYFFMTRLSAYRTISRMLHNRRLTGILSTDRSL